MHTYIDTHTIYTYIHIHIYICVCGVMSYLLLHNKFPPNIISYKTTNIYHLTESGGQESTHGFSGSSVSGLSQSAVEVPAGRRSQLRGPRCRLTNAAVGRMQSRGGAGLRALLAAGCSPLPGHPREAGFHPRKRARQNKTQVTGFLQPNVRRGMPSLCHILFIRGESVGPGNTRRRGVHGGLNSRRWDAGEPFQSLPVTE